MEDSIKILSDILNNKLSEDIDNSSVDDLAALIKKCEDCIVDVYSIQQTIKLARTGDFEVLIPQNVSKRLFKALGLDDVIDDSIYIEDLVKKHPEVISPLAEMGIVCIACGEPVWGTLEELVNSQELNIKSIVEKINQIIEDKN